MEKTYHHTIYDTAPEALVMVAGYLGGELKSRVGF